MAAAMHNFPRRETQREAAALAADVRPLPVAQAFDVPAAKELLTVAHHALSGGRAFVDFIDQDRRLAASAGIETAGIEVAAILGGERVERLVDALEEAVVENEPARISIEGLAEMRRLERLLAEASSNVNRFTGGGHRLAEASRSQAERERRRFEVRLEAAGGPSAGVPAGIGGILQGQLSTLGSPSQSSASDGLILGIAIGFGALVVAVIVAASVQGKK